LKDKKILGKEGSVKRRIIGGFFWSICGAIASKVLMVFISFYIARALGKEGYGELAILQNTINTLGVLAGLGVGAASTKYIAQYRNSDKEKAGRIISLNIITIVFMGLTISISVNLLSSYLSQALLNNKELGRYLEIGSFALFFSALNGALLGALSGFEKFKIISVILLVTAIANGWLQFTYVDIYGIKGVIVAIVSSQIISLVLGVYFFYLSIFENGIPLSLSGAKKEISMLVNFNLPAILGSIMVAPVNWIGNVILVNQEKGYEEMGVFGVGNQWKMALLFIPMATWKVILPILSNLIGSDSGLKYKRVFFFNFYANGVVSFMVVIFVYFFSTEIMSLYGKEFVGGESVLVVLVCVAGLMAVNGVIGQAIASQDRMWIGFFFNLLWGAEMLILSYYLCPLYGALGLAFANLIAYCAHTIVQYFYVRNYLFRGKAFDS